MTERGMGRYKAIRDYTLLIVGAGSFVTGVVVTALGNPYGPGIFGAALIVLGLVPTLQRSKE